MEARRYGRFVVQDTLGAGGMGEVYRARDERLGRDVAIKTIRNVAGLDPEAFRSRFIAEARALAAVSHPAIVSIHDVGIENDEPFLILELVDGPSLKAIIEQAPLPVSVVRELGIQIARGLATAHERGILHRDLKPANILRGSDGEWKLADFGIARVPDSNLTMTGQFLGTPAYAAPEALLLGQFSEKSDVYSLAATLVEAVTGVKLRGSTGVTELLQRGGGIVELPPNVPDDLARVLRPALAIDPANRPTAEELATRLAPGARGTVAAVTVDLPTASARLPVRISKPTRIAAAALGGLVAVGILAAILASGGDDKKPAATPTSTPSRTSDLPPIQPGRVTVVYPEGLDGKAYKLDEYERKFEPTPETEHLRAQIEALPSAAFD